LDESINDYNLNLSSDCCRVDFILDHFSGPIFPRKIMTRSFGCQLEVNSKTEIHNNFKLSNYIDCRINAYPSVTRFNGANKIPVSFIMIDLDLSAFTYSKEKLDRPLKKSIRKIHDTIGGTPTILWTGNGYHIYQPVTGYILEEFIELDLAAAL